MGKNNRIKDQKTAILLALLAVTFWSTIGSAFKITLRYVSFIELVLYSSFIAVILLFLILKARNKTYPPARTTGKDVLKSALYGFLNPYLYYMVLIKAYDILFAQEAVVLNYTWPLALVLLSIPLLKQKIGIKSISALLISFFGIVIIATKGDFSGIRLSNELGVILALSSSFIWATFWILNMKDKRDEIPKLLLNFLFGFIYILITALLTNSIRILPAEGYLGVFYIGVFEMGLTFVLWLRALKLSSTTAKIGNLIYLSPFLSLVFVSIAVGEKIMDTTWTGLIFIVAGILLQQINVRKRNTP